MNPLRKHACIFSLVMNFIIFAGLSLLSVGGCTSTPEEEVIPMEFLVVTEENAADFLSEEPGEETEPEEETPEPEPEPEPDPLPPPPEPDPLPDLPPPPEPDPIPLPKPEPKKETPKPKPKPKPAPKPAPKPKPKYKSAKEIKIGKRTGPVVTGKKNVYRPATSKALSSAEIAKMLGAGARSGNRNQVPKDEAARCLGNVMRSFRDACDRYGLERPPEGDPWIEVVFGNGGSIRSMRVSRSSGDRAYDAQALAACRLVRSVPGLSQVFLSKYRTLEFRLDVN